MEVSGLEVEDRSTIPTETHSSGIETNDTNEDLAHRESTSEEEEKEKKANQFSPDSAMDGFTTVKQPEDFLYQHQGDFLPRTSVRVGFSLKRRKMTSSVLQTVLKSYLGKVLKTKLFFLGTLIR